MEESWDFEFLSRMVDSLVSFLSEFVDDWLANDMRVAVFKILFTWLIISLVAIHFAWKVYGNTVNDMYYRQGECLPRCSIMLLHLINKNSHKTTVEYSFVTVSTCILHLLKGSN